LGGLTILRQLGEKIPRQSGEQDFTTVGRGNPAPTVFMIYSSRKNNSFSIFFWILSFFLFFPAISHALETPPALIARVNDYAGLLDPASRADLDQKLKAFEDQTTNQIVVVTFPSLEGESLEDFSIRLAEKWKIGQKGRDNGVILLIFKNDRKLRIEVGYGLEGVLPDAISKSIIQNEIVPHFKQGDFKGGIFAGVDAIMAATKGEYQARTPGALPPWAAFLFLILLFLFFIPLLIYALFLRPLFSFFWPHRFPPYRSSYSGGSSGWSSSWGGGGGGGGFSGGGGSFGGGGSSGSW
jgi:uncharacterized protein